MKNRVHDVIKFIKQIFEILYIIIIAFFAAILWFLLQILMKGPALFFQDKGDDGNLWGLLLVFALCFLIWVILKILTLNQKLRKKQKQ
jgi:hypothetical protein